MGIRPLSSRSRSSRSSTGFSFDGDRGGGRGGGDEDDNDSVASARSTPGSRPSLLGGTMKRSRSAQALGDSLEDAAAETGGVKESRVANRERRSMSTTSYHEPTERAATSRGGGNRSRAWTGGEASGAWSADLRAFAAENDALVRPGGGGEHGRPSEARERGLQRISAVWNSEKDGPLSQIPVPFDRVGRRWSRTFNVDAANTAGPLETSGATLGVSVSALTGQFHRTRVVTLYPRLIVRNFLGIPLEVSCLKCVSVPDRTEDEMQVVYCSRRYVLRQYYMSTGGLSTWVSVPRRTWKRHGRWQRLSWHPANSSGR